MALWLDDTLSEQDRWLDMTPAARACLIELWLYCKRARNNGCIKTGRLHRVADSWTPEVMSELLEHRWLHRDGQGCGSDDCPQGVKGITVMHNFLQHQESAKDMSLRIERSRERSQKGNHKRWHTDRGVFDDQCKWCVNGDEDP